MQITWHTDVSAIKQLVLAGPASVVIHLNGTDVFHNKPHWKMNDRPHADPRQVG